MDVAAERGLDFEHFNGRSGRRYIIEIMGSGGGFLDYDLDGDMDLYVVNSAPLPESPPHPTAPRNRLYRNDGRGHFEDATESAGVGDRGFGMGVAIGDIDRDGDPDLLVTNFGPDVLYRNRGDGSFEDISSWAGIADSRWTSSAIFVDYDGDGDLDLYVSAYLDFSHETFEPCVMRGREIYCGPDKYDGIQDRLYANDGAGRFVDVTREAGILGHVGKGLGVVAGDFDADGDQDIYVANDSTANFLFINTLDEGRPGFREEALFYGAAYGQSAQPEGGMGTDLGDYDGDGDLDIVVTNLEAQTNSLYRNDEGIAVLESSFALGLGSTTLPWVGFGVRFLDFERDGDLDIFVTNGHVMDNVVEIHQWGEFAQQDMLFENDGASFTERCPGCWPIGVGRGLATADIDDDGDLDMMVTNNDGAVFLLDNVAEKRGEAIGLKLSGRGDSNPDAYGARVSWSFADRPQLREVRAGSSYLSSSDPRLLLPVASGQGTTSVSIRWPDGSMEGHELDPGSYHTIVQGEGVQARAPFTGSPEGR